MNRIIFLCCFVFAICCGQSRKDVDTAVIHTFITSLRRARISEDDAKRIAHCCVCYGKEHEIDPLLVAALIYHESGFNARIESPAGAKGLGQIKDLNFPDLSITDPFDIEQNVRGTAQFLKSMITLWDDHPQQLELGLASYYKGCTRVKSESHPLDEKTGRYISNILAIYHDLDSKRCSNKL